MKVEVYWNIRKKCFSVRQNGKVYKHVRYIALEDVQWVVQPGGNKRVRSEGRKNVHAFARGHILYHVSDDLLSTCTHSLTYNPYEHTTFVARPTGHPVHSSTYALFSAEYSIASRNYIPTVTVP